MAVSNYQKLTVWQKAMDLAAEIYSLAKKLPKEELYSLSAQMRRAAVSIPSNIAEGNGRQTEGEFQQFVRIARGSAAELETQLLLCEKLEYLANTDINSAINLLDEISKMTTALMRNSDKWRNRIAES